MKSHTPLLVILLADGLIWLKSSYGKITSNTFADSLPTVLTKFASANPHQWYKTFLETVVIPNYKLFGTLTMWGELFVAVILILSIICLFFKLLGTKPPTISAFLALMVAMFLNANFWLASGWTSPASDSLNILMFVIELTSAIFLLRNLGGSRRNRTSDPFLIREVL